MQALERITGANATQLGQLVVQIGDLTAAVKVVDTKREELDRRVSNLENTGQTRRFSLEAALQTGVITVVTSSLVGVIVHWLLSK